MALFTAEERKRTAEEVSRLLSDDPRIEGVVVVGSLVGDPDRWSDIDLAAVVADEADCDAVSADWVGRLYEALPILHHFEAPSAKPLCGAFCSPTCWS
jgi:predicted nucleotidyltransferase